jgi:hypothetical protein
LNAGGELKTTPVILDLDRDGDVELVVAGLDQLLYAWSLPLSMQEESWTQWGANSGHTFHLNSRNAVIQPGQDILPVKKTFCYPNPTQGQSTNIRYTLSQAAEKVSIRIFDMAGELVQELPAPSTGTGDHDVTWSIASVQSGVYLARVEAQAGEKNSVVFIKIAVVK